MADGSELDATQRTFFETFLAQDPLRDPDNIRKLERALHKRARPHRVYDENGQDITDYSDVVPALKEECDLDRRRIAAEIAEFTNEFKPELVHRSAEVDPLIRSITDTFAAYEAKIQQVAEDDRRKARSELLALTQAMHALQDELKVLILGWIDPDSDDAPVELWSADLGKALKAYLPKELEMLEVPSSTATLKVPRSLYDLFVEDKDLVTPAQIQAEAGDLLKQTLDELDLQGVKAEYDLWVSDEQVKAEEAGTVYEDDAVRVERVFNKIQAYVDEELQGQFDDAAKVLARRLQVIGTAHAERAQGRIAHMKRRKLRIAGSAAAPIIGIAAGSTGVILGAIGIAATPATAGVSGVAGAGVALASIATLRASAGGIKLLLDRNRSLATLTTKMHDDVQSLLANYQESSDAAISTREIGGTLLNSVFVVTCVKTLPKIAARFSLIEDRAAKVATKQIEVTAKIDQLLKDIETDQAAIHALSNDNDAEEEIAALEEKMAKAGAKAQQLIEKVIDMGQKIQDFTTKYGRCRILLTQIDSMIGSKTTTATMLIPVLTEFAFLLANAGVGVAGVAETAGLTMQLVNSGVVLVGEVGDGLGAIDA
ncbi:MAG: hypothetical protein AAFO97_16885 [Pseudomonadota bacterium]